MKFNVRENKQTEFIAGIAMILIGVLVFVKNIYVATPFNAGGISIGGFYLRTGIFVMPLIAALIWLFLSPKKKLPAIFAAIAFVIIVAVTIGSVAIRVSYISLPKWILLLVLIFGGMTLVLRAVKLSRKK